MLDPEVPLAHVSGRAVVSESSAAAQTVDERRIERGSRTEVLWESSVELKRLCQAVIRAHVLGQTEESIGGNIRESVHVVGLVEHAESTADHSLVGEGECQASAWPELIPARVPDLVRAELTRA